MDKHVLDKVSERMFRDAQGDPSALTPAQRAERMGAITSPKRSECSVDTWFERDRSMVRVIDTRTDEDVVCWWDDDVVSLVEDGFLNPRDYTRSALDYCLTMGMVKP